MPDTQYSRNVREAFEQEWKDFASRNHVNDANTSYLKKFRTLRQQAKSLRVLYVEDDPMIGMQYQHLLERIFGTVDRAEDGEHALTLFGSTPYDLVITDIEMPRRDGLSMIRAIKTKMPDMPILITSAHNDSDILKQAIGMGVAGYLLKPIERNEMLETLDKTVRRILQERKVRDYTRALETAVETKSSELRQLHVTDEITGLFNLAGLERALDTARAVPLMLFKILDFKKLNAAYGYEAGDALLAQAAALLQRIVASEDALASCRLYRVSGAHFALLGPLDAAACNQTAGMIVERFEQYDFIVESHLMKLEICAGIAEGSGHSLLTRATDALRMAQRQRLPLVFLEKEHGDTGEQHRFIQCKNSLKIALDEGRIVPYYQPIMENSGDRITKYEALVRLIDSEGEAALPASFLPVAKKTRLYPRITRIMVQSVLRDFALSECSVSINLSIDDIRDEETRRFILEQAAGFPEPGRLVFELLESEEIHSLDEVRRFFGSLKRLGCKVAIDDFGSGYSNFTYLISLNIDYIKIDGSLIKTIDTQREAQMVVEMIVGFAKKAGIKTIAEFVSIDAVGSWIKKLGVDESQGFLIGKPVPYSNNMNYVRSIVPEHAAYPGTVDKV